MTAARSRAASTKQTRSSARPGVLALIAAGLFGCAGGAEPQGAEDLVAQIARVGGDALAAPQGGTPEGVDVATIRFGPAPLHAKSDDPLAGYPTGERQRRILCARPGQDAVRAVFCGATPPVITSLIDLQRALNLDFHGDPTSAAAVPAQAAAPRTPYPAPTTGAYPAAPPGPYPAPTATAGASADGRRNPQFALTTHSTSLVSRLTSAINPRAIIFRQSNREFVAMAYVRGEQFVELVTRASDGGLSFFLVRFRQACNDAQPGCRPGDLFTPAAERDWTSYSIYGGEDVRNSVVDCAQCHQPSGPSTPIILRMQEQLSPWTHWVRANTEGGAALLADYRAAKGNETFAGIPGYLLDQSSPFNLQVMVANQGFGRVQDNEFLSAQIEEEVVRSAAGQPTVNVPRGKSATWEALYEKNVRGESIAVPYHDVKVTDPQKLATLTETYARFRAGALPASELPDLSQIFPDDRATLAELGFAPKPGLDGPGLVRQLCSQCHNDKLDKTLSRARFNVDLSTMSREEKYLAAQRVLLPEDDIRAMPPRRFRTLTNDERAKIVDALSR